MNDTDAGNTCTLYMCICMLATCRLGGNLSVTVSTYMLAKEQRDLKGH